MILRDLSVFLLFSFNIEQILSTVLFLSWAYKLIWKNYIVRTTVLILGGKILSKSWHCPCINETYTLVESWTFIIIFKIISYVNVVIVVTVPKKAHRNRMIFHICSFNNMVSFRLNLTPTFFTSLFISWLILFQFCHFWNIFIVPQNHCIRFHFHTCIILFKNLIR